MRLRRDILRAIAVATALVAITLVYRRLLPANPTTVALTFLVLVLMTSAWWGFRVALVASVFGTALFNFFFLPPFGTFTIEDPQNWVALFAFLVTAVVASDLAERARKQAELAQQRRREVERLYELSQQLLVSENQGRLFNDLPGRVVEIFGAQAAALRFDGRETVYRSSPDFVFDNDLLLQTQARGEISQREELSYFPLRIGVRPAGAFAMRGASLSRETLEAIGSLLGIAAERARAIEELAHSRAEQESERLRVALLDSVTHEFRTPLTSIKASVTGLLDEGEMKDAERRDLLMVIDEETDRLNRLVGEAAEMAQLDAHMFTLEKKEHSVRAAVEAAVESLQSRLNSHTVSIAVPPDLALVRFDFERITEVLVQLLENAVKYSPAGSPIRISAESSANEVSISIADQGSGIDPIEQPLIFEKFYRGREQRFKAEGTGMGLAIAKVIVEAHGGALSLVSQLGSGSVFTVHLPLRD